MAQPQSASLNPKQQVLRDLELARASLAHHAGLAAREWSPRAMLSQSLERHRMWWIGGAVVAGLAAVKLIFSGSNNRRDIPGVAAKNRGLLAFLIAPLLAYGRKAAMEYGTQILQSYISQKVSPNAHTSERV